MKKPEEVKDKTILQTKLPEVVDNAINDTILCVR